MMPFVGADINGYEDERDFIWRLPLFKLTRRPIYARRENAVKLKMRKAEKDADKPVGGYRGNSFSANGIISKRQSFRMLTLLMIASGTLVVPQLLAAYAGGSGVICIIAAHVIGYALMAVAEHAAAKKRSCTTKLLGLVFFLLLIVSGYYAVGLFVNIIGETLLTESSESFIIAMLMILVIYGASKGIESMARVPEIIFLFLLMPLALMLIAGLFDCWRDGTLTEIMDVTLVTGDGDGGRTGYIMCLVGGIALSLIGVAPALSVSGLSGCMNDRKNAYEAGRAAIVIAGIFNLILYLVLLGIFGLPYLALMEYPVITLMSTIPSSLGFFKRADAFMTGVIFFLLYIYISTAVYFAWRIVLRVVKYGA
jgi:hypothetical protein